MGKFWDAFNHRRLLQIRNNRTEFFLNRIFGGFVAVVAALFESMGQTDSYTKKILKQSYSYQRQQSHFCTVRKKLGEIKLAVVDAPLDYRFSGLKMYQFEVKHIICSRNYGPFCIYSTVQVCWKAYFVPDIPQESKNVADGGESVHGKMNIIIFVIMI